MTLEEAIKHAEEVAEENEKAFVTFSNPRYSNYGKADECKYCAEEHRQLAEWLKDYKRLLDNRCQQNVDTIKTLEQEPKFVIKSDGTIEQIKNCNDCLLRKEWEKIGKMLSAILEKQTEQEPCEDAVSRQAVCNIVDAIRDCISVEGYWAILERLKKLPSVNPQKIGHWILTDDDFVYCSECEDSYYQRPIDASWYYCPHCGARMGGAE